MDGNTKPMCTVDKQTRMREREMIVCRLNMSNSWKKKHTDAGGGIIRGYWGEMLGKIFRYSQSRNSLTKYNIYIHNTFVTMVIIPPVS